MKAMINKKNLISKATCMKAIFFFISFFSVCAFAVQESDALLDRANALYQEGRYPQAILLYRKALARGADPVAVSFNTGNCLFQTEKYPEAAAAYRKAVDFSMGKFSPALFNLASVYFRLKLYPESIATYHRALTLEPTNSSGWLFLGEAYTRTGDKVGTVKALQKAYQLDSIDITIVYQLSEAYIALEDFDLAIDLVRKAYTKNPEEIDFLVYLGDVYRLKKEYDASAGAYREALVIRPDDVSLLYKLADVLAEGKQEYMAMDILSQALLIKPSFSDAAIFLGNLAFDAKWWDRAEQAYEQAAKYNNKEAIYGFKNLAYEASLRKNNEEALQFLKKALQYYPEELTIQAEILNLEE